MLTKTIPVVCLVVIVASCSAGVAEDTPRSLVEVRIKHLGPLPLDRAKPIAVSADGQRLAYGLKPDGKVTRAKHGEPAP